MERSMGLEPTPGPWQGPVLPLYYDRPKQENSNMTALRRQDPAKLTEKYRVRSHKRRAEGLFHPENLARLAPRGHPTCSTRAVLTTGDLRCRSANLTAFARSV